MGGKTTTSKCDTTDKLSHAHSATKIRNYDLAKFHVINQTLIINYDLRATKTSLF